MTWIIAAFFFPGLLVYVFSRVTHNYYVGLGLALALICASAYAGYTDTWLLIIIDACSLTFGLWLSIRYMKHIPSQST